MLSLLKDLDNYKVVLASQSPRRFELLKMIGMEFIVRPSHVDEIYQDHLSPREYVIENARVKGESVAAKYPDALVISADTIVHYKGEVLEKPGDEAHAMEILKKLSGHTHEVLTGFGIFHHKSGKKVLDFESTNVTFRKLSSSEINAYIASGESFDKAGGYGAQGLGALLIKQIDGCFFNVVGFPLPKFFIQFDNFLRLL